MDSYVQLRYNPTLESVLMVETMVKKHSGEFGKYQLWRNLPKGMMYQTFCVIVDYLMESNKIAADREGKIAWVWNPRLVRKYLKRPDLFVKQNGN